MARPKKPAKTDKLSKADKLDIFAEIPMRRRAQFLAKAIALAEKGMLEASDEGDGAGKVVAAKEAVRAIHELEQIALTQAKREEIGWKIIAVRDALKQQSTATQTTTTVVVHESSLDNEDSGRLAEQAPDADPQDPKA